MKINNDAILSKLYCDLNRFDSLHEEMISLCLKQTHLEDIKESYEAAHIPDVFGDIINALKRELKGVTKHIEEVERDMKSMDIDYIYAKLEIL